MSRRKLAIGSAQFGLDYGISNGSGKVSLVEVESIIGFARSVGIDIVDTAVNYGDSETVLGQVGMTTFGVVSKLPAIPTACSHIAGWVDNCITDSLGRLRIQKLYGLLLHNPSDLLGPSGIELARALDAAKQKGLVQKIGVSVYDPWSLDLVWRLMHIDLVQCPLNIVDRRMQSTGWLKRLKNEGVEIHVRSCFLQGLLLMRPNELPSQFLRWKSIWMRWERVLRDSCLAPLEICLAYLDSVSEIDRVVVGIESMVQLRALYNLAPREFDEKTWRFMQSEDERLINPSCWKNE